MLVIFSPCGCYGAQTASELLSLAPAKTESRNSSSLFHPDQPVFLPAGDGPENQLASPFIKHLGIDQKQFSTQPFYLRWSDGRVLVPFAAFTVLMAHDAAISRGMTQRPRPFAAKGTGTFFQEGALFPSGHSAIAWSVASVIPHEYPRTLLEAFVRDAKAGGVFLTTYLPANWRHRDYRGEGWYGTNHESDAPGCIHHRFHGISENCKGRGLTAQNIGGEKTHGQTWLRITRCRI